MTSMTADGTCTVVYDRAARRPIFMREKWSHPAWHPGART
jgi:hypothetical protein